jgi:hypothetical protein
VCPIDTISITDRALSKIQFNKLNSSHFYYLQTVFMHKLYHVIAFTCVILIHVFCYPMLFIRISLYVFQSVGFYMMRFLLCFCSVAVIGLKNLVPVF